MTDIDVLSSTAAPTLRPTTEPSGDLVVGPSANPNDELSISPTVMPIDSTDLGRVNKFLVNSFHQMVATKKWIIVGTLN